MKDTEFFAVEREYRLTLPRDSPSIVPEGELVDIAPDGCAVTMTLVIVPGTLRFRQTEIEDVWEFKAKMIPKAMACAEAAD